MPKAVGEWKVCSKCKEKKHVNEFRRNRKTSDGFDCRCKVCHKVDEDNNREHLREIDRKSYYNNRERRVAKSRMYGYLQRGTPIPDDVIDILFDKYIPRTHEEAIAQEKMRLKIFRNKHREEHNEQNKNGNYPFDRPKSLAFL